MLFRSVYSNKQASGLAYLGIDASFPGRLPGNELLNGMHVWLNMLKRNYPDKLRGVDIDRGGYVRRQAYAWLMQRNLGTIGTRQLLANLSLLGLRDWCGLAASIFDRQSWERLTRMFAFAEKSEIEQQWGGLVPLPDIRNIAEFAAWATSQQDLDRHG